MPSPFPGMDPYLEDPGLWPDFHHRFISIASDLIAEQIRPKYFVRIEERVYVSEEDDSGRSMIVPDVQITAWPRGRMGSANTAVGVAAVVEMSEPLVVDVVFEDDIREARIEIVDREGRAVVTVIELLSPSNKLHGSRGRTSYVVKRAQVLNSPTHWVEFDLLRAGVGFGARPLTKDCEYFAQVARADRRPKGMIWPIRLDERLPVVAIPLKAGDPDVPLDLQAVLATAYDRAGYDLTVDYRREPSPTLSPEWAGWSDRLLKAKGLRTG